MAVRKPTRKVSSNHLKKAVQRLSSMKSIAPDLDLGNGLTITSFEAVITAGNTSLDTLNMALAKLDEYKTSFLAKEKEARDWSERMLDAVSAKFGKDSLQYEQAGGVRKSQRKRPVRKNRNGSSNGVSNGNGAGEVATAVAEN